MNDQLVVDNEEDDDNQIGPVNHTDGNNTELNNEIDIIEINLDVFLLTRN